MVRCLEVQIATPTILHDTLTMPLIPWRGVKPGGSQRLTGAFRPASSLHEVTVTCPDG